MIEKVEKILIKNALVLTEKGACRKDLFVENGRFAGEADKSDLVIEGNYAAVPGFVNAHTHAAMTLFRGYAEDMPLMEWLEKKIWPLEKKLKEKHVYAGTKLACVEMLKSGCTAFNDMYFFSEAIAKAVEDCHMRACISSAFFDFFSEEILEESLKRVKKDVKALKGRELIIPAVGPHAPYTVSLEGLKVSAELAEEENALIHFHLAETEREVREFEKSNGKSVVKALDEIGFLSERLIVAHAIWLSEEEMRILAERGVSVAHCPVSNMKLCSGVFNFPAMLDAGVNVCLGTDGAASNNALSVLEEMKFAALLQKVHWGKPEFGARKVFEAATVNGYSALKLKGGRIEEGYVADFALYDLNTVSFCPNHSLLANIVYSASNSVRFTFVNGTPVVVDGYFISEEDELKVLEEAKKAAGDLMG